MKLSFGSTRLGVKTLRKSQLTVVEWIEFNYSYNLTDIG